LYSGPVQVFFGTNTSEWASGKPWYSVAAANNQNVKFGPSATSNGTIYAYGIISSGTSITEVVRRELNATIIADVTTTPAEGAVISDTTVTVTIPVSDTTSSSYIAAVGPGYLAILSTGSIGSGTPEPGVQVTIISTSATSASPTLVSANVASNSFTIENIWYDIGSGVFFFTYILTSSSKNTLYLGGITASTGALYWAIPGLAVLSASADTISDVVSGPNNWFNSTDILVAYKDTTASPGVTYLSSTAKSTSTTAAGTPATLVTDTVSSPSLTYVPIGVWASEYTWGISLSLTTTPSTGSVTYSIENYLNSTTMKDSGLTNGTAAATKVIGWPLTTGYTLLGEYAGTTSDTFSTVTSYLGSFYANGTANTTIAEGALFSSLAGPFNVFADINGTFWIGWTDLDDTPTVPNVYNLYVARLQQQIFTSESSGNALTTLMAFVAFCLVAVFAF